MIEPEIPADESERQAALDSYGILDTPAEENFDNITELMAHISGAPICLVALLDHNRNWLKSHRGVDLQESPRDISFCGHAINSNSPIMVVEDARKDKRFHDNPLVTEFGAIFYAGVPLNSPDGYKLGTLCIYDHQPREMDDVVERALIILAKQVEVLLELRRQNRLLHETGGMLQQRNDELAEFARTVSHDLKSPIANIMIMAELVETESEGTISLESRTWLGKLRSVTCTTARYIDDLLDLYTTDKLTSRYCETVVVASFLQELRNMAACAEDVQLTCSSTPDKINVNRATLMQILFNLVTNSIKYCDKKQVIIEISIDELPDFYQFSVQDNGSGIPGQLIDKLFRLYSPGVKPDRQGKSGSGIGLSQVKKLVRRAGGEVSVQSIVGQGTLFTFSLAKIPLDQRLTK